MTKPEPCPKCNLRHPEDVACQVEPVVPNSFTIHGNQAKGLYAAVYKAADRPAITRVQIRSQSYGSEKYIAEATDGHVAYQTVIEVDEKLDPDTRRVPLLIPGEAFKKIALSEQLRINVETGDIILIDRYGTPKHTLAIKAETLREYGGRYPEFESLFPKDTARMLKVGLSHKVLKQLAELSVGGSPLIGTHFFLEIPENLKEDVTRPIKFTRDGDIHFRGLIMPCRIHSEPSE